MIFSLLIFFPSTKLVPTASNLYMWVGGWGGGASKKFNVSAQETTDFVWVFCRPFR